MIKAVIAAAAILICAGCTSDTAPARKSMSAFSDETYVWEQFQQSTNRADVIAR